MKEYKVESRLAAAERLGKNAVDRLRSAIRFFLVDSRKDQRSSALGKSIIQTMLSLIFCINVTILFFIPISFCVLNVFDSTLVFTLSHRFILILVFIPSLYIIDVFISGKNLSLSALFFSDQIVCTLGFSRAFFRIPSFKKANLNFHFSLFVLVLINLFCIALSGGFIRTLAVVNIFILLFSYFIVQRSKCRPIHLTGKNKHVGWSVLLILTACMLFYFLLSFVRGNAPLTRIFSGRDINLFFQVGLVIYGLCLLFHLIAKEAYSFFKWIEKSISFKKLTSNTIIAATAISCSIIFVCSFLVLTLQVSLLGVGIIKCIECICFNFVTTYSFFGLLFFTVLFFFTNHSFLKYLSFNLIFIFFIIIIVEKYLFEKHKYSKISIVKIIDTPGTVVSNQKIFGYAPVKNSVNHIEAYAYDSLLWKQTYTIDRNGQRITPEYKPNKRDDKSVLFFGCSMTFGHGLRDEGAYPYKVGQLLLDKFKVYNFAYPGYGPHQALSILEHNLTDSIVEYPPEYFFYAAIPEHVNRIIDLQSWRYNGPKFILDENNKAKFVGYFDEVELTSFEKFRNKFFESEIFIEIHGRDGWSRDVDLFIAMIDRMQEIIKKKYPACEFHIMYWDNDWAGGHKGLDRKIMIRLKEKEKDWHIHYMRDIIPGYGKNQKSQFVNLQYDSHQKEFVNDTIASYIVKNIITNK